MKPKDVQALRKAYGMTQQELADRIGANRVSVARWENGTHPPRGANLKALRDLAAKRKAKR
jgi:DNA-binding transcriptional regulator YiaG